MDLILLLQNSDSIVLGLVWNMLYVDILIYNYAWLHIGGDIFIVFLPRKKVIQRKDKRAKGVIWIFQSTLLFKCAIMHVVSATVQNSLVNLSSGLGDTNVGEDRACECVRKIY